MPVKRPPFLSPNQPIGLFDSGVGGLTVAHAVTGLLPAENLIYFGDLAHMPYGDKSTAALQAYSVKIADVLLQRKCKVLLIACNSASAAAYELVKEYVGSRAHVLNVIDPTVEYLGQHYAHKTIGLIGTKQTVNSGIYQHRIDRLGKGITLKALATPLLVPMIEEGDMDEAVSQAIIAQYLGSPQLGSVQGLVLGCTHYPLLKQAIHAFYKEEVDVIDASSLVASELKAWLESAELLNPQEAGKATHSFLVSDHTHGFETTAQRFFGHELQLEKYPLWE